MKLLWLLYAPAPWLSTPLEEKFFNALMRHIFVWDRQIPAPSHIGFPSEGETAMFRILKKRFFRDSLLSIALLSVIVALVLVPSQAMTGAKNGLALCCNVIVPSLFPFFVLSSLAVDLGLAAYLGHLLERVMRPLFRVSGSCAIAVVLGFVGGYPLGAKTALELYRQGLCSKVETERLLAFCNNSGPAFILGVVGAGIFGSGQIGLLLYASHCLASLMTGLLFRFYGHDTAPGAQVVHTKPIAATTVPAAFTGAVVRSFSSTLNICAFVIFFSAMLQLMTSCGVFSALARLLSLIGVSPQLAPQLVAGLLELTSGVSSLGGMSSSAGSISMAAFMLGWAGLSVHCQVLCFLIDSDISPRTYLLGKLMHGTISAFLTYFLATQLSLTYPVSFYLNSQTQILTQLDFRCILPVSLSISLLCWLLLVLLCRYLTRKTGGK